MRVYISAVFFCQNVDLIQRLEEIRDCEGTAVTKVCTYVVCVVLVNVCLVKIYLLLKVYIDCCNQIRPYLLDLMLHGPRKIMRIGSHE